jgi:hypothetical protein
VAKLADVNARGPAKPAARTDTPLVLSAIASAANDGGAPAVAKGSPIPSSVGPYTDVATPNNALDVPIRQAEAKSAADHPDRTYAMRPLDQDKRQAADVRFSSPEEDDGVPKLFSSHFAMSDGKPDVKMPEAANVSPGNAKIPEMKTPARARSAAKRQAASHTAFAQASPENRSTPACSGSCAGDPPLFGVGF